MLSDSTFDKFKYILYKPPDVSSPPLIVVLHGSGEIGSSLSKLKQREPYISLSKATCKPAACILMPQLPKGTWGDYKASLKKLIDHVATENGCSRVAISGHSLGANGTLDMLLAYPDFFCSASVLSPCKDIGDKLKSVVKVPVWFFAGEKENNYRKYAISMHDKLEKLGGTAKLTIVPGYGHPIQFTWVSEKYKMFDWLTSFKVGPFICDVAKYQGLIDWSKLAPVLDFVVIKASGKEKDPYCDRNIAAAKKYGVPWHTYHYLYCTTIGKAVQEARLFSDSVGDNDPLFWVLDCETGSGIKAADARKICEAFEAELRRLRGNNIRVAVYIAHELYKSWALDYSRYAYVWIPRYGSNDGTIRGSIAPDHPCDIWQYTSEGKVLGISDRVDLNILTGTKPLEYFTTPATDEQKDGGGVQMFTGRQLAEFCKTIYANKDHWCYWYGTYGNKCTESKYRSKKAQYPGHYTSDRTSGYMKDIEKGRRCADCVGLIKAFFWTSGRYDTDPVYKANNCPDKSANGMIAICKKTGPIKDIPDIPGLVVWKENHIGVYVGDGYTIEMKGFAYDCRKVKVTDGPWTKWGMLPDNMISYDDQPTPKPEPEPIGDRELRNGDEGADVKQLQENLIELGFSCGSYGADGEFGDCTEMAVEAFQRAHGLPDTGVYDAVTREALEKALDEHDVPADEPKWVEIVGGDCYIRSAPNKTNSKKLGVAHRGDKYQYQGQTSDDGWHLIAFKNQNAWVSPKYSRLVK